MKSTHEVYAEIIASHQELEQIPADIHLFCPRVSDDDIEDYDDAAYGDADSERRERIRKRVEEGQHRLQLTSWASLILGINRDQADRWLPDWIQRTESFLVKCDSCVRAWHMGRKALRSRLLKEFDEETTNIMERRLHDYDSARIDRGLRRAVSILEQHGAMSSAKLVAIDAPAVLAFYEALCCVEYLCLPENRRLFNFVFQKTQEKKPLKIASAVIPTMTVFLFQADPLRNRFARTAWGRRPADSLTPEQFEWAVSDHLADAIDTVSKADAPDSTVQLFWDGFLLLLGAMSADVVLHCLRGMQISLDVYQLAVQHLDRPSVGVLAGSLRGLCALMDKSSKAFWDALSLMNPPQLPMFVCHSPAFATFLARSFEPGMQVTTTVVTENTGNTGNTGNAGSSRVAGAAAVENNVLSTATTVTTSMPLLVAFVRSLMRSLNRNQRSDVCDFLLSIFLTSTANAAVTATREGHSTCIVAGLAALQLTLDGYLDARYRITAESALFVTTVLNSVVKHQEYVVRSANLHPGDRYNIGLSQAAVGVVASALALDTRAMQDEWRSIMAAQKPGGSSNGSSSSSSSLSGRNERRSAQLWHGFRSALGPGKLDVAQVTLVATLTLRGIQRFSPRKRQLQVEEEPKRRFNAELEPAAEAIAQTIERIGETLSQPDLKILCADSDSSRNAMEAVASMLVHAEDAIREAGFVLVGALVGDDDNSLSRAEMVGRLVSDMPVPFLTGLSTAVEDLTGSAQSPFEPMRDIFRCSNNVLDGLCDTSTGLLRSRALTAVERRAVRRWWTMEWQFVDHSFLRARGWSEAVEKATMENYCRDVMEFARRLMAQDGLVASALDDSSMTEVLDGPRRFSMGLFEMIQLRDQYLVGIIVDILVQLFTRLKEFNLHFPDRFVDAIRSTYLPHPQVRNKFRVNTNMNDTQRAELMKAIGDGGDDDSEGVEIVSWLKTSTSRRPGIATPVTAAAAKKKGHQMTIDAWSRGASSLSSASSVSSSPASLTSSSKDAAAALTPGLNRHRALLDRIKLATTSTSAVTPAAKPDQKALLANRAAIREARQRDKAEMDKHRAEAIAKARALRAEAVPPKSEIMVDSASEDDDNDDDEDDDDDESELIRRGEKGEQMLDEAERRKRAAMKQMLARMPVKKVKQQRSAKDMRARIVPSMDKLHQAVLEWDIFHEGTEPPTEGFACSAVADSYLSPVDYKKTFFPLLISEAWRAFVTAKDESTAKPFGVRVVTRMSVDNFLEVSTTMPAAAASAAAASRGERPVGEGDMVLLSRAADPLGASGRSEPHCLARVWKTAMKRGSIEVTYRLNSRKNPILPVLVPGAEFRAIKITNMTTIEREYAALESLQYYDLMDEVLKAEPSPMLSFSDGAVAEMQRTYELNRGQAVAILHGKTNDGFTLVQGPPGTGKTKTIVAMVGALLTGTFRGTGATVVAVGKAGSAGHGDIPSKKLLVCAPSNAAVDELVLRLKRGVKETTGTTRKISVVRLGRSDVINAGVKDVTLEELVKTEMERGERQGHGSTGDDKGDGRGDGKDKGSSSGSDREKLHQRAGEIKAKVQELLPALEAARCNADDRETANRLQREHDELRSEQRRIGAQIERDKESGNTYAREAEIKRRQVQQKILNEAHVLCATLSGSGHDIFKNLNVEFETVIIDEAAQCVELSALIPLKYGCAKCVLVGDPKQLPPTVLSQSAAQFGYDQSLFVRMQRNRPRDVHLLDTQYRMHPEISRFPSRQFYDGLLVDGGDMARLRAVPWHDYSPLLGPYRFFDVEGVQAKGQRGRSLVNENEVRVALELYRRWRWVTTTGSQQGTNDQNDKNDKNGEPKIGIITPYKAQLHLLRQRFAEQLGDDIAQTVDFNTTDAFQGRECDVIIFSCVRASPTGGIGFMTDIRRMNVGLTRARSSLWILGDSRALRQGQFWNALIHDARDRGQYTGGDVLRILRAKDLPKSEPSSTASTQPKVPRAVKEVKEVTEIKKEIKKENKMEVKMEMSDGSDYSPPPPPTYTVVDRPGPRPALISSAPAAKPPRTDRPIVQSSAAKATVPLSSHTPSSKKRPLDSTGSSSHALQQPAKRLVTPDGLAIPRLPSRRPTDPSALEVLGIEDPTGPPSNAPTGPKAKGPAAGPPNRPKVMMRPKKKGPADPFIKKKPKRP